MKGILITGAIIIALAGGAAAYTRQNLWVIDDVSSAAQSFPVRIKHLFHHEKKAEGARTILNVPPAEMPEVLAESYRLHPDKRFMLAVADIDHFFSGKPEKAAHAEFKNGQWGITYKGQDVGSLPELPDFYDFTSVLSQWVRYQNERYPLKLGAHGSQSIFDKMASVLPEWVPFKKKPQPQLTAGQVAGYMNDITKDLSVFMAPNAIKAARQANSLWQKGQHTPAVLYSATKSLVLLDFQGMDRLEIGDALPAKALAMLAITKTLTGTNCQDEEALLSFSMGYSNYAAYIGRYLPQADPVGAYVTQDNQRLAQLASAPNSGTESHYLLLTSIARTGNAAAFANCVQTYFQNSWLSLPVFKAGLDMNTFSLTPEMAQTMPSMVIMSLEHDEGIAPDPAGYLKKEMTNPDQQFGFVMESFFGDIQTKFPVMIDKFESGLNNMSAKYAGPFLGPQTYKAFYMGYFYSGLYDLGMHYLDALSSSDAAAQFAGELGAATSGTASDFRTWYTNLTRSKQGRIDLADLSAQINNCKNLGAAPFMRTFEEQEKYYNFGDPKLFQAAQNFVPHLDTRIADRLFWADVAKAGLLDLHLDEKLLLSSLTAAGSTNRGLQLWYAGFTGNMGQITALMNLPLDADSKIQALQALQKQNNTDTGFISNEYLNIIEGNPDNWNASWEYARFLKKEKQYPAAISVLRNWLNRKVQTLGLEDLAAHARIARLYYDEGRYNSGWSEIAPYIQSEYGGALGRGALLLDRLGRHDDAEKLGLYLVNRYPDDLGSRLPLVEIYWQNGKYSEAADLLKSFTYTISSSDWRWTIGPVFGKVFENKPDQAIAAFEPFISKGFDQVCLSQLGLAASTAGDKEMAFNLVALLNGHNMLEQLTYLTDAYGYLKSGKSKQEALAWLHTKVPPQMYNPLSEVSYDQEQFDLLWDFIDKPYPGEGNELVWVFRAAASLKMPITSQQRQEVTNYFSGNAKDEYFIIGKYLLGLAKKQDVLAFAKGQRSRCEVAYYLGLKAQKEGRYKEASDWYRVSVETGRSQTAEYRWAYNALYLWGSKNKSLEWLAKNKV